MEEKLSAYRTQRERQLYYEQIKSKVSNLFKRKVTTPTTTKMEPEMQAVPIFKENLNSCPENNDDIQSNCSSDNMEWQCDKLDIIYYTLIVAIWLTLWIIFIKLQFGAVYFIISSFIIIYFNTRTRKKEEGEVSAYSVFNRNCESIDGTLKAEDLEKQYIYGRII